MANLLKTDYKDEIKAQGVIKKQFKLVDVLTGALLNGGNPIQLERSDTPSQKGSTLSAKDVNDITKAINLLLGTGWGDKIPPYTNNCLMFDSNTANKLMFYNNESSNKPPESSAGIVLKFMISGNAYSAIAIDLTHMRMYYVGYSVKEEKFYGWYRLASNTDLNNLDSKFAKALDDNAKALISKINDVNETISNAVNNQSKELHSFISSVDNYIEKTDISINRLINVLTPNSIVVNPAGNDYFTITVKEGRNIIPLYMNATTLCAIGVRKSNQLVSTGNTALDVVINKAVTGNITFKYLIV